MLELVQDLMEECELMMDGKFEEDVTSLLAWLCKLVNGNQAEICMQAIQILDSDRILIKYTKHEALFEAINTILKNVKTKVKIDIDVNPYSQM